MRKYVVKTKRLKLRRITEQDLAALKLILQDKETMYAYEHSFSDEETETWLTKGLARYEELGFGLWAVERREDGQVIGQCGLTLQDIGNGRVGLEVGYLFRREFWHCGYATEAARVCRDYAFKVLKFPRVYSVIRDNNAPSIKVAERNGMAPIGYLTKHYYGMDMKHVIYCITREDWKAIR